MGRKPKTDSKNVNGKDPFDTLLSYTDEDDMRFIASMPYVFDRLKKS